MPFIRSQNGLTMITLRTLNKSIMIVDDLFEQAAGQELSGYLNPQALSRLLPAVNNQRDFSNALTKLRLGQEVVLTLPEKMQLSMAFISLVRAEPSQKQNIMRNLMSVHGTTLAPSQPGQPPGTQPTAA